MAAKPRGASFQLALCTPKVPIAHLVRRPGMTLVEVTVALAIVAVLGVIIVQCLVWSLQERVRLRAHQAALELAANVLEAARALPWEQLEQPWADAQTIPAASVDLLPEGKMVVTIEPVAGLPRTRRITVALSWQFAAYLPRSVQLTTLLSARSAKQTGGGL